MAGLARFVLRHRLWVALFWIVIFVAGMATSSLTTERLKVDFSLPGQDGYETAKEVAKTFHTDTDAPYLLVVTAAEGSKLTDAEAATTFAAVAKDVPEVRIIDKTAAGGDPIFGTSDGRTQFAYAFAPLQTSFVFELHDPLVNSLKANAPPGAAADLTGLNELSTNGETDGGPGVLIETLLGALGALAVLAFVFASLLALVPLLIAGVAISSTFLIVLGLTYIGDISFIVQFLISLVGLGIAIDYSLLLVTRWREERDHGKDNNEAIITAMETAGHAVFFSGLTVAISLCALVILPVPFLRSVGVGGLLIPLVSVAVSTTLLPAFLSRFGPKVDWPKIRHENSASKFWTRWSEMIVKHRVLATVVAVVLLVALIVPATTIRIGNARSDSLAQSGVAFDAVQRLEQGGVPKGVLTPIEVFSTDAAAPTVAQQAKNVSGVVTTFVETGNAGSRGGQTLTMAIPMKETADASTTKPVRDLKKMVDDIPGVVGVVGIGSTQLDFLKSVYGNFPLALALILLVTYILLVRAFRSLLLPLKAVVLNLASLTATFGALVLFWQKGYGSEAVYDIAATGAMTFWIPIMIFAFLFGLSMDYEVFILSRMREEWDATKSTSKSVIVGLGRTGRLVTSAALILFFAFTALSLGPQTDIKLLATGLGFGILLDATIIRMLLVPALVSLFGEWNWYLPNWAAKILRVEPSPRESRSPSKASPIS